MSQTVNQFDMVTASWVPTAGGQVTSLVVTAPDASVMTLTPALGLSWLAYFTAEQIGTYQLAWSAVSPVSSLNDTVIVTGTTPEPAISIQECYQSLNLPLSNIGADSAFDADILAYAEAATKVVEGIIGPIRRRLYTEYFDGLIYSLTLSHKPTAIVSVTANGQPLVNWVPDFMTSTLIAIGAFASGFPQNIAVKYYSGSANVAANVLLAVREEFRHLWQLGRQGGHAAFNQQVIDSYSVPSGFAIPNRVHELLHGESDNYVPGFA